MKASKESSSRLCPLGDVPPSSAHWGVSGVVSLASDPALVSGGSRGSASPGVLVSARAVQAYGTQNTTCMQPPFPKKAFSKDGHNQTLPAWGCEASRRKFCSPLAHCRF